ncbi:arylesterase [Salipiger sp. PrR002]|uniref:arylesterase n=1 Tax=Salipiger sp. PrR002 TaxID=2706489 RepID=UPI0013B775DC|nr:arylesterase [Salipiger sp. PrR002]NDV98989.1 arylesterase [Salipiger sp. PrR002]NDW55942.1 arylesterase [Salipiger sp. PrR004]
MARSKTYGGFALLSKAAVCLTFLTNPIPALATEVLALGDSLTQGYGLPAPDGLVPQLQAWLSAQGHEVTIVNGGVSGDTTAGGLSRVAWSLTPEIDAMIVTLGGNDMLRGLDPAEAKKNLAGILQEAQSRDLPVLLVGMSAPGNYGADYKAEFDAIYPALAEEYGTLLFEDFFAGLREDGQMPADATAMMQGDGIHPNADGVVKVVEALGPKVEELIAQTGDD